ncbi:MAG: hypothetical protein ABIZ04_11310 [Opitutus sp.]
MAIEHQPFISKTAQRSIPVLRLLLALTLAILGVWLIIHDRPQLNQEASMRERSAGLEQEMVQLSQRSDAIAVEIPPEQSRIAQSEKIIRELTELQSTWNLLTSNRAQQRANDERMRQLEALHATSVARLASLQQELAHLRFERESLAVQLTRVQSELRLEEAKKNSVTYKLGRGWLRLRGALCLLLSFGVLAWIVRSRNARSAEGRSSATELA